MDYLALLIVFVSACFAGPPKCRQSEFPCGSDRCVALDRFCNGEDDCGDKSDEPRYCTPSSAVAPWSLRRGKAPRPSPKEPRRPIGGEDRYFGGPGAWGGGAVGEGISGREGPGGGKGAGPKRHLGGTDCGSRPRPRSRHPSATPTSSARPLHFGLSLLLIFVLISRSD